MKVAKHGSHREHIVFGVWRPLRGPSRPLAPVWPRRIGGLNGQVFARPVPRCTELARTSGARSMALRRRLLRLV